MPVNTDYPLANLKCVALLDWEMVRLGNPLQDLAWWIASDRALTSALQIDRLEGLGRVGQLMKELGVIPEESDFDVQNPGSIELRSTFERL